MLQTNSGIPDEQLAKKYPFLKDLPLNEQKQIFEQARKDSSLFAVILMIPIMIIFMVILWGMSKLFGSVGGAPVIILLIIIIVIGLKYYMSKIVWPKSMKKILKQKGKLSPEFD